MRNYFRLEDPTPVQAIGLELRLEAEVDGIRLRGIIDRLELDADGELVVTDYKTGAAPSSSYERKRLSGRAHLLAAVRGAARPAARARCSCSTCAEPLAITTTPTDQSTRGTRRTLGAVWQAVERACDREDFRPQPVAAVRLLRLPGLLPVVRRRSRPRRAGSASSSPPSARPSGQPRCRRRPTLVRATATSAVRRARRRARPPRATGRLVPIAEPRRPAHARRPIARFDAAVDAGSTGCAATRTLDRVMYTASELGDFSLIWHLIGGHAGARRPTAGSTHAVRVAVVLGVESPLVNGLVKTHLPAPPARLGAGAAPQAAPTPHVQLPVGPRRRPP